MTTKVEDSRLELPINSITDLLKEWKSMSEICSYMYKSNLKEAFRRILLTDGIEGKGN